MCKHKMLFLALLFCFRGLASQGQSSPIKVEIKVAQTSVKDNEAFSVSTELRNTGQEEKLLQVWSCSYPWQWETDNSSVHVNQVDCLRNTLFKVRLKVGETYERSVSVRVELAPGEGHPESVTFRLGFQDAPPETGSTTMSPPIWSNAVTVSVTP